MLGFFSGNTTEMFIYIMAKLIVLFTAFPIHECAHGYMAKYLGDDTAERQGRLTLNPLAHIDPMGALFMILAGFGWAKPVPTNPRYYTRVSPKTGMALTALAGPASNVFLAWIVMIAYKVCMLGGYISNEFFYAALYYIIIINLSLAVFNLLPIPPLDGSRISLLFLKERTYFKLMEYERYIFPIFFLCIFLGLLDRPLGILINGMWSIINFLTGFVELIF